MLARVAVLRSPAFDIAYSTPRRSTQTDDAAWDGLERLRRLLGVDAATITQQTDTGKALLASSGMADLFVDLDEWRALALAADGPLVVADAAASLRRGATPRLRFYGGIFLPTGQDGAPLLLSLADRRPRSEAMAQRLAALAIEVTSHAVIGRLSARIAEHTARSDYLRRQFDRASATAQIGIWECDLASEELTWTNGVYDLFELPRGSAINREQTLACYTPQSRLALQAARAHAIANCSDFNLVAEIVTTTGKRRWMRLTGAVEAENGVAVRIFGMKQDITEEKLLADRTRYLAEYDVMTGLANRSQFQARLDGLDDPKRGRLVGALLLIDLDGFKQINDTHGHALGDECLKEAAMRLIQCCGGVDLVARIGGDEFAVLSGRGLTHTDVEALGATIVEAMARPLIRNGRPLALAASVGVAHRETGSGDDLFRQADMALYAAKAAGRNTSRVFKAA